LVAFLSSLCGLYESEGCVLRQQMMAPSHDRNAVPEDGRCRKWPATTSKLNDNSCDTLSPQYFTTPAYRLQAGFRRAAGGLQAGLQATVGKASLSTA